jgi:hypothetical protein
MQTNYSGSYLGIAGLVVMVLSHFGISASVDQVIAVIGGVVIVYGIIHQALIHKQTVAVVNTLTATNPVTPTL